MDKLSFLDQLTILSFFVGLQNLELNEQQVNNLESHLKQQDGSFLEKIVKQNEELLDIGQKIIDLLKEKNNA